MLLPGRSSQLLCSLALSAMMVLLSGGPFSTVVTVTALKFTMPAAPSSCSSSSCQRVGGSKYARLRRFSSLFSTEPAAPALPTLSVGAATPAPPRVMSWTPRGASAGAGAGASPSTPSASGSSGPSQSGAGVYRPAGPGRFPGGNNNNNKRFDRNARNVETAPQHQINGLIKAERVRLIVGGETADDDDQMIGIVSIAEALLEAERRGEDLVLINEKGDPPVCKVIDYGKFKYSLEKKKKENLKKQIKSDIKEVKMSYKIEQHDFEVRVRAIERFLADGDRVKVLVQFKGREMQHKNLGRELLDRVIKPIEANCVLESPPKDEGRAMAMLLGPKK